MMASEGVIATLFYRIANDEQLGNHYREMSFYRPFVGNDSAQPDKMVSPYENVNLKLFAALEELHSVQSAQLPMILVVQRYAKLFPDEAKRIYTIFIETTWGATVSQQLASALARAAHDGGRGDIGTYRRDLPWPLLDSTIGDVAGGKRALDENVGAEIWIVNSAFKIARQIWSTDRVLPITINLNTATEVELMTIPGVDILTARRIVAARNTQGSFRGIDELRPILPPDIMRRLNSMSDEMKKVLSYQRD
jgi:hypothetical protein